MASRFGHWSAGFLSSFNPLNPYTMELTLTLIGLPLIEIAIFIWLLIRKDKSNKNAKIKQDPYVTTEDMPARYEDYEEAFYNP